MLVWTIGDMLRGAANLLLWDLKFVYSRRIQSARSGSLIELSADLSSFAINAITSAIRLEGSTISASKLSDVPVLSCSIGCGRFDGVEFSSTAGGVRTGDFSNCLTDNPGL
jgi:hypothetical protein